MLALALNTTQGERAIQFKSHQCGAISHIYWESNTYHTSYITLEYRILCTLDPNNGSISRPSDVFADISKIGRCVLRAHRNSF